MAFIKHGAALRHKKLYFVWKSVQFRCESPKSDAYPGYGGRGIRLCTEWQEPMAFVEWALSNGYEAGLTLDRIDNDGDYSPDNCRFVDRKAQARNRRSSKIITYGGASKTAAEWGEEFGMSSIVICGRLRIGWSIERALTTRYVPRKVRNDHFPY